MTAAKPILTLILALPLALPCRASDDKARGDARPTTTRADSIDWDRARSLYQREQRGEKLTRDEQAYLDRAKEIRRKMQAEGSQRGDPGAPPKVDPPRESTGLVPLTQMKADASYKGLDGGLYGRGRNDPPERLLHAALSAAAKVEPLDADGRSSRTAGRIVLMSMGMSNTTMEFSRFKRLADDDPSKSPKLVIVDAAQGGQDALKWDVPPDAPRSPWRVADEALRSAGVTPRQVRVIWLKQALAGPQRYGEFPKHADALRQHVESAIAIAKARYPNLQLVYLSSRIYAGYATTPLNPEPYAYEGAFAMRGVIDDELKAEALDPPIVLWGPYLWTDGVKGRAQDALVWNRDDCAADGTHPSPTGRDKVAQLLLTFFKADPTTKPWFAAPDLTGHKAD